VDAVVGTGFTPPLKGMALAALEWIQGNPAPVLAIDLPSGWPADSFKASLDTSVFPADGVITFTAPKPAHVFGQLTRRWDQPIVIAPIGSPDVAIVSELQLTWAGSAHALTEQARPADSNKGKFGHVLVIGGSVGKSGAPAMTSLTAMRAGAGLVTAAVPAPVLPQVSAYAPELMTWPIPANSAGQIASKGLTPELFESLTTGKTVIAVGPGLGQGPGVVKLLTSVFAETKIPVVIDADALNTLAANPQLRAKLGKLGKEGRTLVLTPHPGRWRGWLARLSRRSRRTGCKLRAASPEKWRHTGAERLAYLDRAPDGSVAVNTTGNPAMAKGGSGDMLTGLIAACWRSIK